MDSDVQLMARVPSAECSCGWWSTGFWHVPDAMNRVTEAAAAHLRDRGAGHEVFVVNRSEVMLRET